MINTLKQTIYDCSDSFVSQAINLLPFAGDTSINGKRILARNSQINRIRGHILPQPDRAAGLFAPDTISWLRSCATEAKLSNNSRDHLNQTAVYIVPVLGITNRPLPGYKRAGFNLFKTTAKIVASGKVKNLDQCIIEFSPRFPVSFKDFNEELDRQICFAGGTIKKKGRLAFYAHGLSNAALASDLEAFRLCALKTMPVINIDWLDMDSSWDIFWNPCSNLKPMQKNLEAKLIRVLDQIIEQVCASRCNVIVNDKSSFFDSTYLPYRDCNDLPKLSKASTMHILDASDLKY